MVLVSNVLGHLQQHLAKIAGPLVLIALLLITSCSSQPQKLAPPSVRETKPLLTPRPKIKQVGPPSLIGELTSWLDIYEPQVHIRQPQAEQIFDNTTVSVVLRVQDLPIYKDENWNMGPHVELLLDNQPYGSVYDIEAPIVLENLTPGTHTIRAFAVRPWHESFKNEGAYAQVTFHVFAKTDENSPAVNQPLLTYGSPVGTYGAEPVLLDFYLTDAPLHQVAQDNPAISDWQIRYTINGESLTLQDWESVYVEGLKPGQNWVQLTLIDDQGNPIQGVFNNTVRLIKYDPSLDDSLAKIMRGELTLEAVGGIVDPSYEPPVLEVPEPVEQPLSEDSEDVDELEKPLESDTSQPEVVEPVGSETLDSEVPETADTSESVEKSLDTDESPEQALSDQVSDDTSVETDDFQSVSVPKPAETERFETPDMPEEDSAIEETSAEPSLEKEPQPVEEINPDTDIRDSLESGLTSTPTKPLETESESSSEPAVDTETVGVETADEPMEQNPEEEVSKASSTDDATAVKPKYFQRLYDYRERSMKTYGRDR